MKQIIPVSFLFLFLFIFTSIQISAEPAGVPCKTQKVFPGLRVTFKSESNNPGYWYSYFKNDKSISMMSCFYSNNTLFIEIGISDVKAYEQQKSKLEKIPHLKFVKMEKNSGNESLTSEE